LARILRHYLARTEKQLLQSLVHTSKNEDTVYSQIWLYYVKIVQEWKYFCFPASAPPLDARRSKSTLTSARGKRECSGESADVRSPHNSQSKPRNTRRSPAKPGSRVHGPAIAPPAAPETLLHQPPSSPSIRTWSGCQPPSNFHCRTLVHGNEVTVVPTIACHQSSRTTVRWVSGLGWKQRRRQHPRSDYVDPTRHIARWR